MKADARAARWRPRLADPRDAALLRDLAVAANPEDASAVARLLPILSGFAFWCPETGVPVGA